MNPFTITWAIITPSKGKVTKKDLRIMNKTIWAATTSFSAASEATAHFANKEVATTRLKSITGLSKEYSVVLVTDKQFGLKQPNQTWASVATKMQTEAAFKIK